MGNHRLLSLFSTLAVGNYEIQLSRQKRKVETRNPAARSVIIAGKLSVQRSHSVQDAQHLRLKQMSREDAPI
jgi:hypothetical protein